MKSLAAFRCILCAKAGAGAAGRGKGPGRKERSRAFLFLGEGGSIGDGKGVLGFAKWFFFWRVAPPARGAGGIPTSPLCPPPDPLYPLQTAEGYPRTLLRRKEHFLLSLHRQGPYRARTLHGTLAAARIATRCSCRNGLLPTLQGQTGAKEPGEGSAAPKATVALPGTDVNLSGRAPAGLAVHCCLATGGPGAAMRHAPFGRPRHPLGTFQ